MNIGGVGAENYYVVECFDKDGSLKWTDKITNLVPTAGLNKLLDACFKTGLTTPAWYVGLKGAGTPAAGDTMASHATWSELTIYSDTTRRAFTPGTISSGSVDNSASKAVFNINGSGTVTGCFMADDSTKSGTTGTLYGVGDFTGGSKTVASGDIINVTVTVTATAA